MTKADELLKIALNNVGVDADALPSVKYANVYAVIAELAEINNAETIAVGTTGTITDRICGWALDSVGGDFYYRLTSNNTKWLGDYALLGYPLNVIVSVKSFKAKERLLMSGTGSQLVPTIGYGLFDDANEFSADRLISYRMRGFLALYMPTPTIAKLNQAALDFKNWNGSSLIRSIEEFPLDIEKSKLRVQLGGVWRDFINPIKL